MTRSEIIERAVARRPAGRPVDAVEPCTPPDAFIGAARQLHALLRALEPGEWDAPAHPAIGTVRELVVHLVGVERVVLGWLEAPDGAALVPTEHLSAARAAVDDLGDLTDVDATELADRWFDAAQRVHAACGASDPHKPVLAHDLPTDVDGLLVLRAFELWAHLQDVCAATGRPCPPVDDERLALMSSRLMAAVPIALLLRGVTATPARVRFVLTGRAGGCYDVVPGDDEALPLTIVADTVDICRVAARRLPPGELDAVVDGDIAAAATILAALAAFARD